jgi:hypothetical protein
MYSRYLDAKDLAKASDSESGDSSATKMQSGRTCVTLLEVLSGCRFAGWSGTRWGTTLVVKQSLHQRVLGNSVAMLSD